MDDRKALLVGSIPAPDTAAAVELALDTLGRQLIAIPDGETGDRKAWVAAIVDRLETNPAVRLTKVGHWSSYQDRPRYRVRPGRRLDPHALDLGYHRAYLASRPVVRAAAARRDLDAPPFQIGMASGFDLALFSLGVTGALRHRRPFNEAAAREIAQVRADGGADVVFQIELPAELVLVARAPALLRKAVARWMGRMAVEIPRAAAPGTRFGMHLCYGDLGNRALVSGLADCSATVSLTNAIVAHWPGTVALDYVHVPFAAGEEPPSTSAEYYAPLAKLRLPSRTRLVAGFVHEAQSEDQQRAVLGLIDAAAQRRVDIAASCGLGRRHEPVARSIMESSRLLCRTP